MKSEKGVTLISLLTYIAVLLTVMVVIGRITGFFTRGLDNVDSDNKSSTEFSKINYCFLSETKKTIDGSNVTAAIGDMYKTNSGYEFPKTLKVATSDTKGTAIKFLESGNIIFIAENAIYYNKTKVCDKVTDFEIDYKESEKSIKVSLKIDNQQFEQTYTFR